jgi:Ni/Fe-hydrogenase subunit HybB-like protein
MADLALGSGEITYAGVTRTVSRITERKTPRAWYVAISITGSFVLVLGAMLGYLFFTGIGVWGNNSPVGWAWDITNFVFWIGIGHAGTLISAILFLLRQRWRTSINRFAEAMTLFAVACAGIYPLVHVGRPWRAYWLFPAPNPALDLWQNFRSPLLWDVFAVSTYGTVSLLFWYVGMIPDLATLRDRAASRARRIVFGLLSLGWRGSARHWKHYEMAYLILAGLSTPLVISVHTIVSFDFAVSVIPGWHTTIFPPYFVAGAVFSGFAMVVTLIVVARKVFGLEHLVTIGHLDNMCKVMLATGSIVGYAYAVEFFTAFFSGNPYERFVFLNRATGPYAWAVWTMFTCNVFAPQLFWFKRFRRSIPVMFALSIVINVGMWFERFVIIVTSLHRDFLPSSWGYFRPTFVDILTFAGSFGLFLTLFLLFVRFLPMIAMSEVKSQLVGQASGLSTGPQASPSAGDPSHGVIGEFETPAALLDAVRAARAKGFAKLDALTPFPIHGIDQAMGASRSRLGFFAAAMGFIGCAAALLLQWWTGVKSYPLVIGGKPLFAFEFSIPITFELTVLAASFGAVFGMLALNGLPRLYHPVFNYRRIHAASDDRFLLVIENSGASFRAGEAGELLVSMGAANVEMVPE